jgi:xyloglucan-specific exo-beta-1,4-glucanase
MVESLEIDPFDSNHWLYGTGLTVYGGHNLEDWPYVSVSSLADGIEETAILSLISPPGGAQLLSGVGDVSGFRHEDLDTSPEIAFVNPLYATTPSLDYAGNSPLSIVRIGNDATTAEQMALSTDGGATWSPQTLATTGQSGGLVAYSANATSIVWVTSAAGVLRFADGAVTTISSIATGDVLASDKVNDSYFYAASTSSFYVSTDGGATFTATASISSSWAVKIVAHPTIAGDVWFSTSTGLYHSTDFGSTFTKISSVSESYAIALGLGTGDYLNLYGFVSLSDQILLRVSSDEGATWTTIQDSAHGFGSSGSTVLGASLDTEGLVFVGTNGRGIFYGLP